MEEYLGFPVLVVDKGTGTCAQRGIPKAASNLALPQLRRSARAVHGFHKLPEKLFFPMFSVFLTVFHVDVLVAEGASTRGSPRSP